MLARWMIAAAPSFLVGLAVPATAAGEPLLDAVFVDNMVVQSGEPVTLRGHASPGKAVTILSGDEKLAVTADAQGRWQASLHPRAAGETFSAEVSSEGIANASIVNAIAGDVWLCSGQSNMDLAVRDAANAQRVLARASHYPIRLAKVGRVSRTSPTMDLTYETPWQAASAEALDSFSSLCWHMAEHLAAAQEDVPLGLVHVAWGGTTIEDWLSSAALKSVLDDDGALDLLATYERDQASATAEAIAATERWIEQFAPSESAKAGRADETLDDNEWAQIELPQMWEDSGIAALRNFDGTVWFRRKFELTPEQARKPLELRLERIDERDTVWVNSRIVGAEVDPNRPRVYRVPANALHAGSNTLAIRVIDERGSGGFRAQLERPLQFVAVPSTGEPILLAGKWRFRTGVQFIAPPEMPAIPWKAPRGMTTLYNGMIAPLAGLKFKGVAWYQGESNTGFEKRYTELLPALVADWRKTFGQPALPVIIAQLPGFGPLSAMPGHSKWAELREAQRKASVGDANIGLAVLVDLGMPQDIHPRHKDVAATRMALEATRVAYRDATVPVAPYPAKVAREGDSIVVTYPRDNRLFAVGGSSPIGYQLCQAKDQCRFANAVLDGNRVILTDEDRTVSIVRYAWQDSPVINLYADSGLAVAPFSIAVE